MNVFDEQGNLLDDQYDQQAREEADLQREEEMLLAMEDDELLDIMREQGAL